MWINDLKNFMNFKKIIRLKGTIKQFKIYLIYQENEVEIDIIRRYQANLELLQLYRNT